MMYFIFLRNVIGWVLFGVAVLFVCITSVMYAFHECEAETVYRPARYIMIGDSLVNPYKDTVIIIPASACDSTNYGTEAEAKAQCSRDLIINCHCTKLPGANEPDKDI